MIYLSTDCSLSPTRLWAVSYKYFLPPSEHPVSYFCWQNITNKFIINTLFITSWHHWDFFPPPNCFHIQKSLGFFSSKRRTRWKILKTIFFSSSIHSHLYPFSMMSGKDPTALTVWVRSKHCHCLFASSGVPDTWNYRSVTPGPLHTIWASFVSLVSSW